MGRLSASPVKHEEVSNISQSNIAPTRGMNEDRSPDRQTTDFPFPELPGRGFKPVVSFALNMIAVDLLRAKYAPNLDTNWPTFACQTT